MSSARPNRIPGETSPAQTVMDVSEQKDLISSLIDGSIDVDNDVVRYFIDRLKSLESEGVEMTATLSEKQQEIKAIGLRISSIVCEIEAYKKDLLEWHRRAQGQ